MFTEFGNWLVIDSFSKNGFRKLYLFVGVPWEILKRLYYSGERKLIGRAEVEAMIDYFEGMWKAEMDIDFNWKEKVENRKAAILGNLEFIL